MNSEEAHIITKGNPDAARFLLAFVAHCHVLDDVIDGDVPVGDERLMASEAAWLLELTGNAFFVQHRAMLVPVILAGFNAWLDANRMEKSEDEREARAADVVKGIYHEVCWTVAFICGGWDHLRTVTRLYREYDYDWKPKG